MIKTLNDYQLANQTFKFECEIEPPQIPQDFFDGIWGDLKGFLNSNYGKGIDVEYSYQELYEKVETICMLGYDERLHKEVSKYYRQLIEGELEQIKGKSKDSYLQEFDALWQLLFSTKELVSEVMIWFERTCLMKKTRIKTREKLILAELASLVTNMHDIRDDVNQQIIDSIMKER
jgi:hypothetical protein